MVDSHCHLAGEEFAGDLASVVQRARDAGVSRALCILDAADEPEIEGCSRVRDAWPEVRFAVGVHPHHAVAFAGRAADGVARVRSAVDRTRAVAVGEIGLDYHYDFSPRDVQRELFAAQVALAVELRLPVIIHTREATDDTFDVLAAAGRGAVHGVFHCFTGDRAMAARALAIGFYISLSGIVSFPKAVDLHEVARFVPEDRLLIETDSPYLAPVPHRGKRNEPAFVARVLEAVAALRGADPPALADRLSRNFDAFLGPTVSRPMA